MTRAMGRPPPREECLARPEAELEPLAGVEEQAVEPVEGDLGRLRRRAESLPHPARRDATVIADDRDPVRLRPADPLAGRFGDAAENLIRCPAGKRQRNPVAR